MEMDQTQVQEKNTGEVETEPQVQEKMVSMTQEQLDKLISDRLARQERKLNEQFNKKLDELSEAQKLAQMSEEERKEHEYQKRLDDLVSRENALNEKESAYNKKQYKEEIQKQLHEAGLPDISDTLTHLGAEEVKTQIDTMKQSFDAQINASIENRIKSSGSIPVAPDKGESRLLTLDEIRNMSRAEIAANKQLVDKSLEEIYR